MNYRFLHPLLFAIYPILFLYSKNTAFASLSDVALPSALVLAGTVILFGLIQLDLRNWEKSALITSLGLFTFFSYGHFANLMKQFNILPLGLAFGTELVSLGVLGLVFVFGSFAAIRSRRPLGSLTLLANIVAIVSVGTSFADIAVHDQPRNKSVISTSETGMTAQTDAELPDIYYIILDGYARNDVLKELYAYDNGDFTNFLTKRGFYIADDSCANYCQTLLSLASSLNMDYLNVGDEEGNDRTPLRQAVTNNRLLEILKNHDYYVISISVHLNGADQYVNTERLSGTSEFQTALIDLTPISLVAYALADPYDEHRMALLTEFQSIPQPSSTEHPFFVFAHVLAPHAPFVFGRNGEPITPNVPWSMAGNDGSHYAGDKTRYRVDYVNYLSFVNKQTQELIARILDNQCRPTVILLQSDHGPGSQVYWENPAQTNMKERISILNAYYFSDGDYADLYPSITPVNSFRIILNKYIGTDHETLPDKSYFSRWSQPYRFIDVTSDATAK